jgi:GGDEF domain-containing protein
LGGCRQIGQNQPKPADNLRQTAIRARSFAKAAQPIRQNKQNNDSSPYFRAFCTLGPPARTAADRCYPPMSAVPLMSPAEIMLWSAAAGAVGMVVLVGLADALIARTTAAWQLLAYLIGYALAVVVLSGLLDALCDPIWPECRDWLQIVQVLVGPLSAAMGCYGVSQWLYANRRDRTIRMTLAIMTGASLVGGFLCFFLPSAYRLPASAALSITTMAFALWLAVRAAQGGDSLAWGLAAGCLLALPAQLGIYQVALASSRPPFVVQVLTVGAALLAMALTALIIWRRSRQIRLLYRRHASTRDPSSGLLNSLAMLQKIIASQLTRRKNGGNGALMAVMLFEPEALLPQIGHSGLNELYTELALRMRRHTGIINPAGRYYDRCFLVLFETMHSPRWLGKLSLSTASSLRQPVELTSLSGERMLVRADIGVGIIHVAEGAKNVDELVHEAQAVATSARSLPSRAALLDPLTRLAVAAESADLGSRWKPMRDASRSGAKSRSGKQSRAARTRPA